MNQKINTMPPPTDASDNYITNLNRAENKLQSSWSSAARSTRNLFRHGLSFVQFVYFFIKICLLFFCRNRLSDVASGAKSIVNRMGRGIAGVGKAGRDSVARNDNGILQTFYNWIFLKILSQYDWTNLQNG